MAMYELVENFSYFFPRLNPSTSFEQRASSEHRSITKLIEDPYGPAAILSPRCFLQGSYKQQTAIYTINDVDIVALCRLWHGESTANTGSIWNRDKIFDTIAAPLHNDSRYRDKVRYDLTNMCIKVELSIRIEILPVVYRSGNMDFSQEPFRLYRPRNRRWEDGYARYHQGKLSEKNDASRTQGNFIPAIKVLKHIRSRFGLDAISFHIECLLHSLPDAVFQGSPANYIATILAYIAATPATSWYSRVLRTPMGERNIFTPSEWTSESWVAFHNLIVKAVRCAQVANATQDRGLAIRTWQSLLGEEFFPRQVTSS